MYLPNLTTVNYLDVRLWNTLSIHWKKKRYISFAQQYWTTKAMQNGISEQKQQTTMNVLILFVHKRLYATNNTFH